MLLSDPWITLTAVAGATTTLRLGTLVSCAYYRNPVQLARIVADVDQTSGGRVVLGLGSGDMPHEFAQMGLAYPPIRERQAALEEALQIVAPLLRGETVTLHGEHFRADGAVLTTLPVQKPHVPILIAGGGERTTPRLVAEYADASNLGGASWAGGTVTIADVERKLLTLDARLSEAGRRKDAILRTTLLVPTILSESAAGIQAKMDRVPARMRAFFGDCAFATTPDDAIGRLSAMRYAGFQYFIVNISPEDTETLELFTERVMPAVS